MIQVIEPTTERLHLRQWKESDRKAFASMSADREVMEFFPKTMSRVESDVMIDKCYLLIAERGWGVWAVERLKTKQFIGMVGLHIPSAKLSFQPCVEILWRLARPHWGRGYATEAATAALRVAFEQLHLEEVVSFAVRENYRSRAVMEMVGLRDTCETFFHPDVPISFPELQEHCLYKISQEEW